MRIIYRAVIKDLLRGVHSKMGLMDRASGNFLDGLSSCQEAIEDAIKRSWKGSIDSLVVERCPVAVEID